MAGGRAARSRTLFQDFTERDVLDEGDAIALLQSRCYLGIASNTRDIRLCDPLPAAGSFPHINEIYNSRERCRQT